MKKILLSIFLLLFLFETAFAQDDVEELPNVGVFTVLKRLGNLIFTLALFLALLFIVYAGVIFVTAGGDPGEIERAKKAVTYAVIGLVVAIVAYGAVSLIKSYLTQGTAGGGGGVAPGAGAGPGAGAPPPPAGGAPGAGAPPPPPI